MDPDIITVDIDTSGSDTDFEPENAVPEIKKTKLSGENLADCYYNSFVKAFSLLDSPKRKEFKPEEFKTPERLRFFPPAPVQQTNALLSVATKKPILTNPEAEPIMATEKASQIVSSQPKKRKKTVRVSKNVVVTPYSCAVCIPVIYFKSKSSLTSHNSRFHGTKLCCPSCDEKFGLQYLLRDHQNLEHGMPQPSKCAIDGCNKTFTTYHELDFHTRTKQSDKHLCPTCGERFAVQTSLDAHLAMESCFKTKNEITTKTEALAAAGSALGTAGEESTLQWFEKKNNVKLVRVGAISKSRNHHSDNLISGMNLLGLQSVPGQQNRQ